jgi:tetrapyrrole methylase family protein/MazG family protein
MAQGDAVFLRTSRHPTAAGYPRARTFDHRYEDAGTFDEVYRAIVADLVSAATGAVPPPAAAAASLASGAASGGTGDADARGTAPPARPASVVYAVPGSPTVAERTVVLLREHPSVVSGEVTLVVHPSLSFLDLAVARLGVDPVAAGVRVVDGESFAVQAAGQSGPLLVAQCWSTSILSDIKLSVDSPPEGPVTVLHHLGLDDEQVWELAWDDLDRSFVPDHLTSLWIPHLSAPVASRLVELDELVHTLRQQCPWDRGQTHGSLARHLLEESYEVLEAIDALTAIDGGAEIDGGAVPGDVEEQAVAHLEEELGDLLFQVYFHAALAAEEGRFTLADVARGVHDKLVSRHPHVFGDVTADTPDDVATNWEALKKSEKHRSSVTEGIPAALPALTLAAKLQRKALAVGMVMPSVSEDTLRVTNGVVVLTRAEQGARSSTALRGVADGEGGRPDHAAEVGELLFRLVNLARTLGVDPETALRTRTASFRASVEEHG